MANFHKWVPGPDEADEWATTSGLQESIASEMFENLERSNAGFPGASAGNYVANSQSYVANGGLPYFKFTWFNGTDLISSRVRFSSALVGMLDPMSWFPGIYDGIQSHDQETLESTDQNQGLPNVITSFLAALNNSGLMRSGLAGGATTIEYSYGERAGEVGGVECVTSYIPNVAEQDDGITRSKSNQIFLGTDADDGTLGVLYQPTQQGANYSQTPQVVTTNQDSGAEWSDLGDAVDQLKPSIDNNTQKVQDLKDATDKLSATDRADTITHPDDVGEPGDLSGNVSIGGLSVFGSAGAVTELITVPAGWALLSSVPAMASALLATAGTLIATVLSTGWLQNLIQGVNAISTLTAPITALNVNVTKVATSVDTLEPLLERIAESLEAIQGEVVKDPEDPIETPGIINVIELASQARAEIEVQTHGTRFIASTGIAFDEE